MIINVIYLFLKLYKYLFFPLYMKINKIPKSSFLINIGLILVNLERRKIVKISRKTFKNSFC
jgi:hypothetical protein